jgi:hypothetical protein
MSICLTVETTGIKKSVCGIGVNLMSLSTNPIGFCALNLQSGKLMPAIVMFLTTKVDPFDHFNPLLNVSSDLKLHCGFTAQVLWPTKLT